MLMTNEFGFKVTKLEDGTWRVFLPHQCGHWNIAGESHGIWSGDGVNHTQAMHELRKFLAEGMAALDDLMRLREHGQAEE
jgi:hypothetical protein